MHVFKLAELHANHLKNLNIDFSANMTRLKGELLDYFQYISHQRVIQIENDIAHSLCVQYQVS